MKNLPLVPVVLAALGLLASSVSVEAHKLKVFATATGPLIEGYAYFAPGGRARSIAVQVAAKDGIVLDKANTDEDGNFRFEATQRIDHVITVDGGDGHVASATVKAAELPQSLPGGDATSGEQAALLTKDTASQQPRKTAANESDIQAIIEQSVARQVRPLREQIDAYQEKIWLHDILGGLGTILGLGGIAFGLSQRRRRVEEAQRSFGEATP